MKLQVKLTSVLVTFISILQSTFGASQSLSACFNSTQKSLNIQCGYGNMVRIIRTFYGYAEKVNGHARCHYQKGDCILEERDTYPCVGRDSCNINLPTGGYGQRISQCNIESNYFQVDYECVPAMSTQRICDKQELTEEWGYISTPNYPNYYNSSKNCEVKIKVKPGQQIKLYIIDMDLESNGSTGCPDWFYAHDNYHSVTLCGKRSNEDLPKSMSNEQYIQFMSNAAVNRKGFWLYYEAFPPSTTPTTTTTTSTTTIKTSSRTIEWQSTLDNKQQQQQQSATNVPVTKITKHINISQEEKIPFAAIVGGVIGTLSVILIVLLVLLAVKWWKERRRKSDKNRFIEVQNPGYRNSNEFRNSGTDMCYNYIDC